MSWLKTEQFKLRRQPDSEFFPKACAALLETLVLVGEVRAIPGGCYEAVAEPL